MPPLDETRTQDPSCCSTTREHVMNHDNLNATGMSSAAGTQLTAGSSAAGIRMTCRYGLEQLGPYRPVVIIAFVTIMTFMALRLAMLACYADWYAMSLVTFLQVLWVGLRFDLLAGLCYVLWQTMHVTLVPERWRLTRASRCLFEFEWLLAALFIPLLCIVELMFFDEFQSRLNYIAFEYLVYPTEVCCNIWESYAVVPYLGSVAVIGGTLYGCTRQWFGSQIASPLDKKTRALFPVTVLLCIAGLWLTTSMDSRKLSEDRVAVECAGNGLYSFVYYALTCRFDYHDNYITVTDTEAINRVRNQVLTPHDRLIADSSNPVDRVVETGQAEQPLNFVMILEESLGSDFIGVLGDRRGLTPQFDRLCRDGLLFTNWYATGNRTARALEAVMTSIPPLPTESILKRDHSRNVYTLARVLEDRGYERLFITGGRGLFDGIGSFMNSNGFNRFLELADFVEPVFSNAWGVCDEDLLNRGLQECRELHASGKPFFVTMLTVSNHRPYTFPTGRIPETEQTRENAVRYADHALGEFFRAAKQEAFYEHTLFVVLGDHGARIYGSQMFPLSSYRVPMLMIGPERITPDTVCETLGCSLDIAPTVLGRLGGAYRSVFFGRDVRSLPPDEGRAVMQHNHDVAVLDSRQQLVILGDNEAVSHFQVDPLTDEMSLVHPQTTDAEKNATALFQLAYDLYYSDRWSPDRSAKIPPPPASLSDGRASAH